MKKIKFISFLCIIILFTSSNTVVKAYEDTPLCGISVTLKDYADSNYTILSVPDNNEFKSFMSYQSITDKTSAQYELQQNAYTNVYGIRMVGNRYCVAVGTYYATEIGTELDVVMENGSILKCIVGDLKNDIHTDETNRQHTVDNSVVEFIMDRNEISSELSICGDVSILSVRFLGSIDYIKRYE